MLIRYVRDYSNGSNKNKSNIWREIEVWSGSINVALGKNVTFDPPNIHPNSGPSSLVTNGNKSLNPFFATSPEGVLSYVQIDLGELFDADEVKVFRYYGGERAYHETKTEVSKDGINWITVFDSAISGTYTETIEGLSIPLKVFYRYIKNEIYNSPDEKGQWAEIQAFSKGENVAFNKKVSTSLTVNNPLDIIVDGKDGNVSSEFVESTSYGSVEIDLGQAYKLDEIKVCHYWDGRVYGHKLSVSIDGLVWYEIWNTAIDGEYSSSHSGKMFVVPELEPNKTNVIRYIRDSVNGNNVNDESHWIEIKAMSNGVNRAFGKPISFNEGAAYYGSPTHVTDEDVSTPSNYFNPVFVPPPHYVQIDLGELIEIDEIKTWHYYYDGRTYNDVITEVSQDGRNWITVFNSNINGSYVETEQGLSIPIFNLNLTNIRYIRDWAAGSDVNTASVWQEIEVIKNNENIALNKKEVTASVETRGGNLSNITDGILNINTTKNAGYVFFNGNGYTPQYVQVDLGEIYKNIDKITVWHFNNRTFIKTKTEISGDGINWLTIFDSDISGTYLETNEGFSILIENEEPNFTNFEQTAQLNIDMSEDTAQNYTAKGYEFIGSDSQEITFDFGAAQAYTPEGYSFQQSTQENILLVSVAAQVYTPIGYHYEAATNQNINTLTQEAAQIFAARFECFGTQTITLGAVANAEHQANFRANASDTVFVIFTAAQTVVFSEGLQFQENTQEIINIAHDAAQEFTPFGGYSFNQNSSNTITATAAASLLYELGEIGKYSQRGTLYLNLQRSAQTTYTRRWLDLESKAEAAVNVLNILATNEHAVNHLEFTSRANEITGLAMAASVQFTNANMLNSFATKDINLTMAANVDHIKATINKFNSVATEQMHLDLLAASDHIKATINEFSQLANESIGLTFKAVSEQIKALNASDLLMFEHWATFEVITEPRNFEAVAKLNITLTIKNWVYFESDIYKPTYKIEVEKPNTLWEPTEEDRKDPYIFGRNPQNKIDRRILNLTHITEPNKISYEKPNTLYTHNEELERGLIDG